MIFHDKTELQLVLRYNRLIKMYMWKHSVAGLKHLNHIFKISILYNVSYSICECGHIYAVINSIALVMTLVQSESAVWVLKWLLQYTYNNLFRLFLT